MAWHTVAAKLLPTVGSIATSQTLKQPGPQAGLPNVPPGSPLADPAAVLPVRLASHVGAMIGAAAGLRVAGDAAEAAATALAGGPPVEILPGTAPDARGVLAAGLDRDAAAAETSPRPLYLRPPDVSFPKARP